MKKFEHLTYVQKIKWRIRFSEIVLILMLIYMIVLGEIGGDSRIMTDLADVVSRILFFGGMIYVIIRIFHNRKLLKNRGLLKEQMRNEQDERDVFLHDKSGGLVLDILLLVELFVTVTAVLLNMPAFYTALILLMVTVILKGVAYLYYSRSC